jgi:hypothetical protein
VGRRVDIEPDDISQLGGKARIARALEGAQPVGLQLVEEVNDPSAGWQAERLSSTARSPEAQSRQQSRASGCRTKTPRAPRHRTPTQGFCAKAQSDLDVEDLTTGTRRSAVDANAFAVKRAPRIEHNDKLRSV